VCVCVCVYVCVCVCVCVHACAHTCIQAFTGVSMLVVHMHMELQQDDFVRRPSL